MSKTCYRKIERYKYQLMGRYTIQTDIRLDHSIITDFIILTTKGKLFIQNHYTWDGPSGPTIDTKTFMRGSLVHDVLYQLMRREHLGQEYRKYADDLLRQICLEDGMCKLRAWWVHTVLRIFAARHAKPSSRRANGLIWF